MVRKSKVVQQKKLMEKYLRAKAEGRKMKHATKVYNRCVLTGRSRGFMRDFGISRICFRELAEKGQVPGVRKSSW
jgi:small subunit ribosomal protein S14